MLIPPMPKQINRTIKLGGGFPTVIKFKNDDGTLMDLTGYQAKGGIKAKPTDDTAAAIITSSPANGVTIDVGAATVTWNFNKTVCAGLGLAQAYYDLQMIPPNGSGDEPWYAVDGVVTFAASASA